MKKKFFAVFFGLIFCLFVGSASASAVESTTSSPTPLSESLSMLDEEYPIMRFAQFDLGGPNDYGESFFTFKAGEYGQLHYKVTALTADRSWQWFYLGSEYQLPTQVPERGYKPYGESESRTDRNSFVSSRSQFPMIPNGEGWMRLRVKADMKGTYRLGFIVAHTREELSIMTDEKIHDYFENN